MGKILRTSVGVVILLMLCACPSREKKAAAIPTGARAFSIDGSADAFSKTDLSMRNLSISNIIVFDHMIVLIGGLYREGNVIRDRNDVLLSTDAKTWRRIADTLIEPERNQYSVGTFGGKIVIVGGMDRRDDLTKPELYRSEAFLINVTTANITTTLNLPPRVLPAVIEYHGSLYVIGGFENSTPLSTVLRVTGNRVTGRTTIPHVQGIGLGAALAWVYKDALYITDLNGDFWKSTDGISWRKLETDGTFKNRLGYVIIPRDDGWYLAGGDANIGEDRSGLCNDVWESADEGKSWKLLSTEADSTYVPSNDAGAWGRYRSFPARKHAAGFVLNGRLVIGGGEDGDGDRQDFWVSDDGVNWEELK